MPNPTINELIERADTLRREAEEARYSIDAVDEDADEAIVVKREEAAFWAGVRDAFDLTTGQRHDSTARLFRPA